MIWRSFPASLFSARPGLAIKSRVLAGHNPQQGTLTSSVASQDTDLGARIKGQPDILQDLTAAVLLGQILNGEDVLFRHERSKPFRPPGDQGLADRGIFLGRQGYFPYGQESAILRD